MVLLTIEFSGNENNTRLLDRLSESLVLNFSITDLSQMCEQ